jgi:hypothetical protein
MTTICDESIGNNFCGCIGTSEPLYIQYNGDGLSSGKGVGNSCCNLISFTPDIVHRLPTSSGNTQEIQLVSKFLSLFNQLDITPCDYTKYFGGNPVGSDADLYLKTNFLQLYDFANRQRIIYNNFYLYVAARYPVSVTSNGDLVPTISGNTISTPSGTTPLIFNYYDGVHSESQYLFITWETGKELPKLPFEYKFFYFYDIHGNECKNNYCTTLTSPAKGISFSSIGPGNSGGVLSGPPLTNETVTAIFIGVVALLIIIFIGVLLAYRR